MAEPELRHCLRAVRSYGEGHRRGRIQAELLAEVHVRAGEPRGLMLATMPPTR